MRRDPKTHRPAAQIRARTALQRSHAAALLHRQHEHRARVLRGHRRVRDRSRASASWTRLRLRANRTGRVLAFFNEENTERVKRQKQAPIFVVIGNPPYNAGQIDENDNNKNRKYRAHRRAMCRPRTPLIRRPPSSNKLSDPYVKAIRWATDRIGQVGIVAFVTNNGFHRPIRVRRDAQESSGRLRRHLRARPGGQRAEEPEAVGTTTHNVFGIQVGGRIDQSLVRDGSARRKQVPPSISCTPTDWRRRTKYSLPRGQSTVSQHGVESNPAGRNTLACERHRRRIFDTFMPLVRARQADRQGRAVATSQYSLGVRLTMSQVTTSRVRRPANGENS